MRLKSIKIHIMTSTSDQLKESLLPKQEPEFDHPVKHIFKRTVDELMSLFKAENLPTEDG